MSLAQLRELASTMVLTAVVLVAAMIGQRLVIAAIMALTVALRS